MNLPLKSCLKSASTIPVVVLALVSVATAPIAVAGPFTAGNLILLEVSGTTNAAGPITIRELTTTGSVVQSLVVASGDGGGQLSATASSEGQLSLNASGDAWTFGVYVPPFTGSGSLSGRTAAQAPRGFMTVTTSGSVSSTATVLPNAYSTDNIRNGVQSGDRSWFTGSPGAGSGIMTFSTISGTAQVQDINSRVVQVINGDLYYSTGSGTQGLYKYAGLPAGPATSAAFLTGVPGQGTSPYDFAFSPSGSTLYVADDGIGVQKFTFDGTAWSHAYNFTSAATASRALGLAVDFSTANPTLYWNSPTDVFKAVDEGIGAVGTSIAVISTPGAFRGLDIVPVPEPSTVALAAAGFGLAGVAARRRLRKA